MKSQMVDSVDAASASMQLGDTAKGDLLRLRPAQEHDRPFLQAVFETTRAEEFAQIGWSPERIASLLAEQFSMQDRYYRQHYPHGRFDVVTLGETAVGRLYHSWHGSEARLIDIALMPAHRGAGIGGRLVRAFVAQAARKAMPVVLYVERNNPVQGLYRRLGFETIGESGVYWQMRRPAVPYVDPSEEPVEGLAPGDAK
ncbi:GNAT family N-acetyltransferase [Trinickia sp. EG282A]|uniref:GNAT family N-acetyltransferase n=1 Tax=Trinickia sp. EG282A TaxID=3237013 RepID=UPI0034D35062